MEVSAAAALPTALAARERELVRNHNETWHLMGLSEVVRDELNGVVRCDESIFGKAKT